MTFRSCPICGGTGAESIHHFSYTPSGHHAQANGSVRVDLVCCPACGFVYKDRQDHFRLLDTEGKQDNRYESFEYEATKAYLEEEARIIGRHFDKGGAILDAGCSTGYLLACLSREGFSDLTGLELSEASCKKVKGLGFSAVNASLCDPVDGFEGRFDVIVLSHVLEHIADLPAGLGRITRWLKPGGSFYIALPDEGNCSRYYGSMASLMCVEHVNHFSAVSLNRLMGRYGFQPVMTMERPYSSSVKGNDPDLIMAAFDSIYVRSDAVSQADADTRTRDSIRALLEMHDKRQERRRSVMEGIRSQGKPCVLWGLTHMAMNLFAESPLFASLPIIAVTDSDPSKHGRVVHGIPVRPPEELLDFDGNILVLDNNSRESICDSIARRGMRGQVVVL